MRLGAGGAETWSMKALVGSLRNRLALLFFTITLAAIAVVYFYVAPSLESSLRAQRLVQLAAAARADSPPLQAAIGSRLSKRGVDQQVRQAADASGERVSLLGVSQGTLGTVLYPISDSQDGSAPVGESVAREAARRAAPGTGTWRTSSGTIGAAALPLFFAGRVARVVVYSGPLSDVAANGALVRRKIRVAGAIALLLALLAGYLVARSLSLRVKRLEQTAERVAAGDFSARFPVDREDELGQLARALDDMQRQLSELDNARKRFIATASHELRTPIFSLGGFLELIQDEELDEETRRQFVGQVREQVQRLGKLATGLLDLSRLEAGSLQLRRAETDLAVLARAVASEFIPALSQHSSHLELRLAREPIPAVCDAERVAQVMRILIDNAITHTPPGTDIVVSAGERGGGVRLVVRDFGPGIDRSAQARLFEPFYTSGDGPGSGLGLAIARELAERMSGQLTVDSRPGATTFTLELAA
ncbi:MAG TPA: HAMP domain-containing sensor histidine kinase [Solirubrobacteraceae bacterium]|nr:HAMP domain-containing sensor histidine kinase [Solirubrobacteraceae bacterium]